MRAGEGDPREGEEGFSAAGQALDSTHSPHSSFRRSSELRSSGSSKDKKKTPPGIESCSFPWSGVQPSELVASGGSFLGSKPTPWVSVLGGIYYK